MLWIGDHESVIKAIYSGSEFLGGAAASNEVGVVLESTRSLILDYLRALLVHFKLAMSKLLVGLFYTLVSLMEMLVDYERRKFVAPNHTCKPIDPELLGKIESIVNEQIKSELDVFSKEATLAEAKRINGLRAVLEKSIQTQFELCQLVNKLRTCLLIQKMKNGHQSRQNFVEKVASLKSRVDGASIPAAKKSDLRTKLSVLQNKVRKAQKKIAEENMKKAVKVATEMAEVAASDGKGFCISQVDVGLDAAATIQ
ncbi:hypothetical protein K2173_009783 [Erythroxylum novogranatense]|uniref:Uncharacterized protein n=1 Tax=Erythroxylum novogranatense TaxID=1862640 RepID=A0AAV8TVD0_9ROSI|nr:hypothetical protein K2173_009783 [Erythroxylum novogranatense]